jgi:two-component system, NarL family, sensor histidine kinase LiaS
LPNNAERVRLAQELHDGIAQDLVAFGYSIDLLLGAPDTPIATRKDLRTLRFGITDLITKVRDEIFTLRNSAPINFLESLQRIAHEIFPNTTISCPQSPAFTHTQSFEILRIATEVIRNASRHAGATHMEIALTSTQTQHMMRLSDNGNGGAGANRIGYGIASLYERAESLGGTISIATDATGTSVELIIPVL